VNVKKQPAKKASKPRAAPGTKASKPRAAPGTKASKPRAAPGPADVAFARLADALDDPRVERVAKMGRVNLRVGGKVFAMTVKGRLVVKLPAARCQALVDQGRADFLIMGRRVMKEWVTFAPDAPGAAKLWLAVAREALAQLTSASA
jgi:hypothetical protein